MKRISVTSHHHSIGTGWAKLRKRCSSLTVLFGALFILHLPSSSTTAQTTTSTIIGTVTDTNGAVVAGAEVKVSGTALATERSATTDAGGSYRLPALPAGTYKLKVSKAGFATTNANIELTLNLVLTVDVQVKVGNVGEVVNVSAEVQPLLEPNKDTVNGGAAAQFNQETIAEFQVLTTGFKAEFGQASGAVINVITKSGENSYHGVASLFHRNEAFDSVNSLDPAVTDPLHLRRFDYSLALGGPIIKKKIFFFGSSERITEDRVIDFKYPDLGPSAGAATVLQLLRNQENPFDIPQRNRAIRNFFKLDEQFGRHHLDQEVNYTNEYARGAVVGLPTTRTSTSARNLLLGFGDTMLLGDQGNPWLVTLRGSYRGRPSDSQPAHPEFTGTTLLNAFPAQQICPPTCGLFS